MLPIVGYLMMLTIIVLLVSGRVSPVPVLAGVPVLAALIAGFSISEISTFVTEGAGQVVSVVALFVFAILYFGVMNDAGLFEPLINRLKRAAGHSTIAVAVATALIAMIAHLDGSGASTFLITVPAMLPIYRRLGMNPLTLVLLVGAAAGVANIFPWGGPTARAGAALNMDPAALWRPLIPAQVVGLVGVLALAVILGLRERRNGAGQAVLSHGPGTPAARTSAATTQERTADDEAEGARLRRPRLLWVNLALTVAAIVVLVLGVAESFVVFLVAFCIALPLNYPNAREQAARINAHAPAALLMAAVLLAAGALLGILSGTGMLEAMARDAVAIMPEAVGGYLHLIVGALAVPLGMIFGPDPYYFALLPVLSEIAGAHGVPATSVAKAMLVGENVGFVVSPVVPTVYLAIGLAGVDLGRHIRNALPWLWGLSLCMLGVAVATGAVVVG